MDQRLEELVEALTTSGEPQLNPEQLKELKKICRFSDEHIKHVYHLLMTQLNQEHAEIRFSAFQIVGELFSRSHQFRTMLIDDFQVFLELTVETDFDQPLPPPKEVAHKLKVLAVKTIQEWHEKFGEAYKKLSLGYHFLKQNKKVDFQDVRSETLAQIKREEEKKRKLELIYQAKAKKTKVEMEEMLPDIQSCLTELESCFKLLLPDPDEFNFFSEGPEENNHVPGNTSSAQSKSAHITASQSHDSDDEQPCCSKDLPNVSLPSAHPDSGIASKDSDSEDSEDNFAAVAEPFLRDHGLGSHKYSLNIEISRDLKVNENEDNEDVVNNLKDAHKLIKNKYWPAVQAWIQVFTKAGVTDESLRFAIDLKKNLEAAMKKSKEMNIEVQPRDGRTAEANEDEDDDFEEVPEKEGYEPHIPDHLRAEYGSSIVSPTGLIKTKKRDLTWMEQTNQTCSEKWVDDLTSAQREEAFKNLNSGCLNSHKGDDKSGSCTTFMSRRARKRQNQRNKKKSKANQQHNTQKSTCQAFQGEATTQPCVNISEATGPSTPVMATGVTTTSFVHIETKCKEAALIELLRESRCHASNSLSTAATATASVVSTVQAWTQQVISQPIKSETERRQEEPRQIKVEESETHQLAMSLIPILNQVPRERLVSVHQELMQVIFRNIPAFSGVAGAMQRPPVPLHGQQPYVPLYSHTAHRGPAPFPILHPTNAFISPRISRW